MADTILEQIADLIQAQLQTVTTGNGYQIDVAEVYRPATIAGINRTNPGIGYQIQFTWGDPERNPDHDALFGTTRLIGWNQPAILELQYRPSKDETVPMQKKLAIFQGDVTQAMFVDPQWSNLVLDTQTLDWSDALDVQGYVSRVTPFQIQFRHIEGDPYSQS